MVMAIDPSQYVDPAVLAEAQKKAKNVNSEVRLGLKGYRGRLQVILTAPEGDEEGWQLIEEITKNLSQTLPDSLYQLFGIRSTRQYVVPSSQS